MKETQDGCGSGCGTVATERNRYFTGKFMAARDFQAEQDYFLGRHRLHNRLLHGWGIVCGLEVKHHPDKKTRPNSDCALRWVIVNAGVAIDCCGRELILPAQTAWELPLPRPMPKRDAAQQDDRADQADQAIQTGIVSPPRPAREEQYLLMLRYCEDEIEPVPALFADGDCDPGRKQANRVRETARFDFIRLADVEGDCWRLPQGRPVEDCPDPAQNPDGTPIERCRDDCPDPLPGPSGTCLDPICPCGHAVPLALITFDPDHPEKGFKIDTAGRRRLPTPPELLTHIVHTNWMHGGEISIRTLRERMKGRLEIIFDRDILDCDDDRTGINGYTFVVEYGGIQHDVEYLPFDGDRPPGLENKRRAVFTIDPDYIREKGNMNIAGNVIYVTLKCNFILDCHENPVDGDHLGGRLPSGDGTPGGRFESWFRVVHSSGHTRTEDYDEEAQ